jgi:hypothetical protein
VSDLRPFCAKYPPFDTDRPWVRAGYQYATDGKIIVRQHVEKPDDDPKGRPAAWEFFESFPSCETQMLVVECRLASGDTLTGWRFDVRLEGVEFDMRYFCLLAMLLGNVQYHSPVSPGKLLALTAGNCQVLLMPLESCSR